MSEARDDVEAQPEMDETLPVRPRRKWQTPKVLLADATLTGAQCCFSVDHHGGQAS